MHACLRFGGSVVTIDEEFAGSGLAGAARCGNFVGARWCLSRRATDMYAIVAQISHMNCRKIYIDIGGQIMPGIANFVGQLFDDGASVDRSPRRSRLGDDRGPVG